MLSHSSLLETIEVKGAGMTEHYVTQLEFQDLQERYNTIRERAKVRLAEPLKEACLEPCLFKASLIWGSDRLVKADRTTKAKWVLTLWIPHWQNQTKTRSSLVAQQTKGPAFSLLWLGSLLRHRLNPWPGNFCMLQAQAKTNNQPQLLLGSQLLEENNYQLKHPRSVSIYEKLGAAS